MSFLSLPKMMLSESEGWLDVARMHPSVKKLLFSFVVPMSLIPAAMYVYSVLVYPNAVFPQVEPTITPFEAILVGGVFVLAEVAMVMLMAVFIQQLCEAIDFKTSHENAFTLAAIAPAPLWLSSLALFVPSLWVNVLAVAAAWFGCVALIRHGIRPLLGLQDADKARRVANSLTFIGVAAWTGLMILLVVLLSAVLGWR